MSQIMPVIDENDIVFRLRKRAEIRKQISTRKSVMEGKPDRISDLLEEAANTVVNLREASMKSVHVTVIYVSEEGDFGHTVKFMLTKTFHFNTLPLYKGIDIILKDDAIGSFPFSVDAYDPVKDMYYVVFTSHEKVHRYYHGDAYAIMSKVVERYTRFGWDSDRIDK